MADRPLLVLDSASLYYRSFYALPESMTAPDGHPHNAIRGFLDTLAALIESYEPYGVVCAWDDDWRPAWRVELLPSYKSHRVLEDSADAEAEPDTLSPQITGLAALLDAWGIARVGADGFEADDVIATYAARTATPVIAVTGDRDLFQVIDDAASNTVLYTASGGMSKWPMMDAAALVARYGVQPNQYVDFAVLRGDPSDGLPGVPGIGEKTAAALLGQHGSLEAIMAAIRGSYEKPLTPRLAEKLEDARSYIESARSVVTAVTDVPIGRRNTRFVAQGRTQASAVIEEWGVLRSADRLERAIAQATST